MVYSMTGYGKFVVELESCKYTIEIKTLNSKQTDISTRMPAILRSKDLEIRSLLSTRLGRGKIDLFVFQENTGDVANLVINRELFAKYYKTLSGLVHENNIPEPSDWLQSLMRLPDVLKSETVDLEEDEWEAVLKGVQDCIDQVCVFREQEGLMLKDHLKENIQAIDKLLSEVVKYESERIETIRTRIMESLAKLSELNLDSGRLEQEMIFYIEKLDISEEKKRLKNHLDYFLETLEPEEGQGKKLGFIAQEIGREINTLGSKSNHVEMQQLVVRMKDHLEQIKEQVLNVL